MDLTGSKLSDRYEIVRELGRGGMGVVYLARDPMLGREVAVKLIPPNLLSAEAHERFKREAQVVARMDHPAIVTVYDFGEFDGALYFVMPVMTGMSLREAFGQGTLRLGDVVDVGAQIADALDYSHEQGVVHRDLKPENVMLAGGEGDAVRVRIMDFGLARASIDSQLTRLTESGALVGTVAYLSPEQVEGRDVDGRSDLYALGAILYECLVGTPPFVGEAQSVLYRIVHEAVTRPAALGVAVDPAFEEILLHCLSKDPARRPQRGREVAEALGRYRGRLRESERARRLTATARGRAVAPHVREFAPFVGRERDLAELQRCLNAAVAGEGQFVMISGEAGIGKTRLLAELERLARARRIRVLHGRFVAEEGFPYQGFCEAIQEYFRSHEWGSGAKGPADFSDLAGELVDLFPVLSEIEELRAAGGDAAAALTGELRRVEDRTAVFELLARALMRLASGLPLVLVFEDLHGADVSLEALQYVVRRLGVTPVLVVGSYRASEVDRRHALARLLDGFRGDRHFTTIQLGPLARGEHRELIEALADGSRLSEALAQTLYGATEGNPFFTVELVRSLIDSGGIAEDEAGNLILSSELGITSDALPETVQQVVERQIERLSDDQRETLAIASVLGRTFEFRELEAVAEGRSDVEESVERLLKLGLLEEREWRGDRLAFTSRVVRDVLYARLPRRRRRALHRRFAAHLEERSAGRLDRVYQQLLHHYSQGDVPEKAVEYGFLAAVKALDAFSAEDAISAIRMALEFLEEEEFESDPSVEGEARLILAGAYRVQGNLADALREAERGARIFERQHQDYQALRALLMAAEVAWEGRKIEETRRWVEHGIELARATGDAWTLSRLLTLGATVANLKGERARAKEYIEEAERLAPEPAERRKTPRGGRLVVALQNPFATALEPARVQTDADDEILSNVFERLLATGSQGNLAPVLCERWEMLDEGAGFLLALRRDAKFSNGRSLVAADVKASFERAVLLNRRQLPAALAPIRGVAAFLAGEAPGVEGIVARSEAEVEIRLDEPLPIYPALLSDAAASIAYVEEGGTAVGTGPFVVASHEPGVVVLERNDGYWRGQPPALDAVEFRTTLNAAETAAGLRSGELDLVRDVALDETERILRDSRMRVTLVDAPRKDSCFVAFNTSSPLARHQEVRRALAGVARVQTLVWQTLGRSALPATGLIPPGMLGHDPGRKLLAMSRERAAELLRSAGVIGEIHLAAAVLPKFQSYYGALLTSLFEAWAELGVRVAVATHTVDAYRAAMHDPADVDLIFSRWMADYGDPDNFTHGIFHSRAGALRRYMASPELDSLVEQARAEPQAVLREALYRRFESALVDTAAVIPLFHETDYRLASRAVRGLRLGNSAPFVNYAEIGKEQGGRQRAPQQAVGGVIRVALNTGHVRSLDPVLIINTEQGEIVPNVFETLTRVVEGARVVPWLAAEYHAEEGGRRFRFRLRDDVRFHDGRRLTARDVRFSFERLLQHRSTANHALLLPVLGARALAEGSVGDLEGFRILSASEFSVELETPLPLLPVMLTNPCLGIVPEGQRRFDGTWREQCAGTGPFRVAAFEPGVRLELERNPGYWREGYPRSEGLVFTLAMPPDQVLAEFRAGRLSLASGLAPADVDALRHDPEFAPRYFETPRLSIAYLALNTRRGPLADPALRRRVARALDVGAVVRRALGRYMKPARGIIPPGLPGYDPVYDAGAPPTPGERVEPEIELAVVVGSGFARTLNPLVEELVEAFRRGGVRVRIVGTTVQDSDEARETASADMIWSSWVVDFPDTDSLVTSMLHTVEGAYGRFCGSPEIDRLVERGRLASDVAARHALYRQVEAIVARDALMVPLFHPHNYRFARPEVEGVVCSSLTYPVVAYEKLRIR
jgi:ABC-type transport system substrate-binding protein